MSKIKAYHIPRDYTKSLEQQKAELKKKYCRGWEYLWADKPCGDPRIHFFAEEIEEDNNEG